MLTNDPPAPAAPIFSCDWTSHHFEDWRNWFSPLVGTPAIGCEIGSFEGRSALFFLQEILTHPESRLICIDPWDYTEENFILSGQLGCWVSKQFDLPEVAQRFRQNLKLSGQAERAMVYAHSSRRILPTLQPNLLDFIYIDGSHLAARALEDAVLVWPALKTGGVLVWDDYLWAEHPAPPAGWKPEAMRPKLGVDAFLAAYDGQYDELVITGSQCKIRKTVYTATAKL